MTRFYPDSPNSWNLLQAAEGWVYGGKGEEERAKKHEAKFYELVEALEARGNLTANEVGYLYWYAPSEAREAWRERLVEEHPGHFFAVMIQLGTLRQEAADDPEAFLAEADRLWEGALDDEARTRILSMAAGVARNAEPDQARLWVNRYVDLEPARAFSAASILAGKEETRRDGLQILRTAIAEAEEASDGERDLGDTREDHEKATALLVGWLSRDLGNMLLEDGEVEDGVAYLRKAASAGWSGPNFQSLGNALLTLGDTVGALEALVRTAADPVTTETQSDSLRQTVGVEPAVWSAEVEAAREKMWRQTLDEATDLELTSATVLDWDGQPLEVLDRLGPEATVAVFFSRYCGYSNMAMPRIVALAAELEERGIPLLAITDDSVEDATEYMEENGWELDVLFDSMGEAARSFNAWGTPTYFVADGQGRLRFQSSLDSVDRHIGALAAEAQGLGG
jgi:peroxiredoxin